MASLQRLTSMASLHSGAAVAILLENAGPPVDALPGFIDLPHPCLFHSGTAPHPLRRFSFLSADPVALIVAPTEAWPSVQARIRSTLACNALPFPELPPLQGGWMGWFSYELAGAFDRIVRHPNAPSPVPDVALGLYDWVIAWDHACDATWLISTGADSSGTRDARRAKHRADAVLERWHANRMPAPGSVASTPTAPDFTAIGYREAVTRAMEYILAGDIFQVNIAQRFSGSFAGNPLDLCRRVTERTPAPMSAFLGLAGASVISASPERFMHLDGRTRRVETRPIKGTRPRHKDPQHDARLARQLVASEKDRAENVMIVDLLRNDLSRVCEPGSIRVPELCTLDSHPSVHHLVSTVTGKLRAGYDALDLLAATFPGGSITGAPKLRAMEIITELEPVARGIYSGAIGWIGLDGAMDTSIAIRTVAIADGVATVHAGGAVTARSNPVDEYQETLDKSRALLRALAAQ